MTAAPLPTTIPSLSTLPSEILQQISTYLPSSSVISLLLVNQSLKRAVDHWSVWRSFITNNPRFPNGIPRSAGEESWKRYVLADIKARRWEESKRSGGGKLKVDVQDLRWLPMLLVVEHPVLKTLTPEMVIHLAIQISPSSQTALFEKSPSEDGADQKQRLIFPLNPNTALSLPEWQNKLAGSFCLAIAHMSALATQKQEQAQRQLQTEDRDENDNDDTGESSDTDTEALNPHTPQLCKVPWFNIHTTSPSLSPANRQKLITALHALSQTAIAHFSTEFSLAISEYHIASTSISHVSHPPTTSALTLPLSHLFPHLPDPFSTDCVEDFGACHLRGMATPDFFEQGEWTGAFAYTGLWGVRTEGGLRGGRDIFDCVGGVNRMVQLSGFDKPNERYEFVIEPVIRFRRVENNEGVGGEGEGDGRGGDGERGDEDGDVFVVRSNCFYSQMGTHVLELRVRRSTGLIGVREWNAEGVGKGDGNGHGKGKGSGSARGAVLTPFGVVSAMGVETSWMWLWKKEWSGAVEGVE
ncbi:hypothetical protein DL95DRAFT_66443 [Leptodontidium sp. 2 PMI_412]|nr:hypothetical protein DL95DRAFT_66443 [Leptodontidium sp. 2 PMI_412]